MKKAEKSTKIRRNRMKGTENEERKEYKDDDEEVGVSENPLSPFPNGSRYSLIVPPHEVNGLETPPQQRRHRGTPIRTTLPIQKETPNACICKCC
jgi:hypothetical protein